MMHCHVLNHEDNGSMGWMDVMGGPVQSSTDREQITCPGAPWEPERKMISALGLLVDIQTYSSDVSTYLLSINIYSYFRAESGYFRAESGYFRAYGFTRRCTNRNLCTDW